MSDYLPIGNALYAEPKHTIDLRPMIDEAIERINFAIDEHIRAKLIALGWMPPEARAAVRELVDAIDRDAFDYERSRENPEPILDRARAFLK